jgi:hypothetical protein
MRIACLGWGSLIWRPENLHFNGTWYNDGPFLPIEYVRKSNNGSLTLVITDTAKPIQTLWTLMITENLETAITSLSNREGISEAKKNYLIGSIASTDATMDRIKLIIKTWAERLKLDAVIWTNLPPKSPYGLGRVLTEDEAISYLRTLDSKTKSIAEEYVRRTPRQIITDFRISIEREFGWTYQD